MCVQEIVISSIILVILDGLFLYFMSGRFASQVQSIQKSPLQLNFGSVLLCYVFLVFGLNYFILMPGKSVQDAFLFGAVINGVYETTTMAAFKKWKPWTAVIDTVWGGVLFASTTYITRLIYNRQRNPLLV